MKGILPSTLRNFDFPLKTGRTDNLFAKMPKILIIVFLVVLSFVLGTRFTQSSPITTDKRLDAPKVKAKQTFNKEFLFSLKNDKGEKVDEFKYIIESVELQDEILVKGQRARAVKGRTFLILNLKVVNNLDKAIIINSRDYMRLNTNGKKELLAPDIHNDPIQIQAISTKYTRLGFPINDTDKNLKLQVGEINGKKETINLNL